MEEKKDKYIEVPEFIIWTFFISTFALMIGVPQLPMYLLGALWFIVFFWICTKKIPYWIYRSKHGNNK